MNSSPSIACAVAEPPAESGRPLLFARRVGRFAWVQMFVQLIGFATGILLVRRLKQGEYALFTIANTMQDTLNVLADIGISIGLVSIGGRVWQDDDRCGQLIKHRAEAPTQAGSGGNSGCYAVALFYAREAWGVDTLRRDPDRRCARRIVPAFSRCQEPRRLGWLYAGVVGGVAGFSLLVLCGAAFWPNQFLFVLGHRYSHLEHELLLMVAGATPSMVAGTLWTLNASRAWIVGSWLYIPLTLGTQLILIPFTDFSSVKGVLTFNLFSVFPSLFLNLGLSYRGFRYSLPAG